MIDFHRLPCFCRAKRRFDNLDGFAYLFGFAS